MTARPSLFPDWALLDVVDPSSGQNNVEEPPAAWKNNGWGYQEKPARQFFNWMGRETSLWLRYLDEDLHVERTVDNIWVDLVAHLDCAAGVNWTYRDDSAFAGYPANPVSREPCYESQSDTASLWFEISDWPEGMTLHTIYVDWCGVNQMISVHAMKLYAARQVWPTGSGLARTLLSMNAVADYIQAPADGNRYIQGFGCTLNNEDWAHETDKLVIGISSQDSAAGDKIYGIRLQCSWYGPNKWAASPPT